MAENVVDLPHLATYKIGGWAEWTWKGEEAPVERKRFAPPKVDRKDVLWVPVPKRQGKVIYPSLHIQFRLVEERESLPGGVENFDVPAYAGQKVNFTVFNVWPGDAPMSTALLSGTVNQFLTDCEVTVDPGTVERWLDPKGPFKARFNENLFDFKWETPNIRVEGEALSGSSRNRAYLYRKKTIIFLPGVFGSSLKVEVGGRLVEAYPNFYRDDPNFSPGQPAEPTYCPPTIDNCDQPELPDFSQSVTILECNSAGEPLVEAPEPKLLHLLGAVYDTFDRCREARVKHFDEIPPEDVLLYGIRAYAYDWRLDLASTAEALMARIEKFVTETLRKQPDTDDQVAVAGHSTGGVIIRRMLGLNGAAACISHAFFMNVPFRGAPKALGVMLTGCDPPGGGRMIDIITPESMVAIALTAPIMYHLSPSFKYPVSVVWLPDEYKPPSTGAGPDIEAEKEALIATAIKCGIYHERFSVKASGKDPKKDPAEKAARSNLAKGADQWARYWKERCRWRDAAAPYNGAYPNGLESYDKWPDREVKRRQLAGQERARGWQGWSKELSKKARDFHEASEAVASSGTWKDKAYIFYSNGHDTTQAVILKRALTEKEDRYSFPKDLFHDPGNAESGMERPLPPNASDDRTVLYEQWTREGKSYIRRWWRLSALTNPLGDGTVPLRSLLGFGGPAKVFKALDKEQAKTAHVAAPNHPWAWGRIMEVLQEHDDVVEGHLDKEADPVNGAAPAPPAPEPPNPRPRIPQARFR